MTTNPKCACGCGTDLKARRDGTFATYAPGGHDSKHKSALVKAGLKGDEKAIALLEQRGWTKYLDKAREKAAAPKTKSGRVARTPKSERAYIFGLTEREFQVLITPPNERTWICPGDHGGDGPMHVTGGRPCWFCHRTQPKTPPATTPWGTFQEALAKLPTLDWREIEGAASVERKFRLSADPDSDIIRALALIAARKRFLPDLVTEVAA